MFLTLYLVRGGLRTPEPAPLTRVARPTEVHPKSSVQALITPPRLSTYQQPPPSSNPLYIYSLPLTE